MVECVDGFDNELTKGKFYSGREYKRGFYIITDNFGSQNVYSGHYFKDVIKHRNEVLEILLNNDF